MKTKIIKLLLTIICLSSSVSASAYDFTVDGIYYNVLSLEDLTCVVTHGEGRENNYTGNVVIPEKVTYNNETFTVTAISYYAFFCCSSLTGVTIPNSVTEICSEAFSCCFGLTSVTIPNSVTKIGDYAFYYCSGLTSVTIGNSVTKIGDYAFWYCYNLTNVTIPNSVVSIGMLAFADCSGLTNVTIPNSVTSIGDGAFSTCFGLTSVTIPNSVTSIGKYAFSCCYGLTELYSLNPTPPTIGTDNFTTEQYTNMNVYVPQGSLAAYQNAEIWKEFKNLQEFDPTGVELIKADGKKADAIYYDIQGRRLDAPKKGLNIINGKKVLMRK